VRKIKCRALDKFSFSIKAIGISIMESDTRVEESFSLISIAAAFSFLGFNSNNTTQQYSSPAKSTTANCHLMATFEVLKGLIMKRCIFKAMMLCGLFSQVGF
jgi:hypothetical protein